MNTWFPVLTKKVQYAPLSRSNSLRNRVSAVSIE
ncbi:Uncharacterised protein [Mycobacteroides abscessus subsp. abscessus]|nr:Uncharacterised protein [Mycobacteroides abscessus subsp. abscessus]